MKTHFFLFLAFTAAVFAFMSCSSSSVKTGWDDYQLKGKVKELHTKHYNAKMKFGELTKGKITGSSDIYFSEEGRIEKVVFTDFFESIYSYEDNVCTIDQYLLLSGNKELSSKIKIITDDKGYPLTQTSYNEDGTENNERTEYVYDEKKQLKEVNMYKNNELQSKIKCFDYNSLGKSEKMIEYDEKGNEKEVYFITYTKDGFMESLTRKWKKSEETVKYSYQLDSRGNYIECVIKEEGSKGRFEEREIVYY